MNSAITMDLLLNRYRNTNNAKPLSWNKSHVDVTKTSEQVGLGQFSRSNNNNSNNLCRSDNMSRISPTSMGEQSSCSTPRRISLNEQESKSINEALHSFLGNTNAAKKTVRFAPETSTTNSSGVLTEEHCKELWYQKAELVAIKHAAKVIIANRASVVGNPNASSEERDSLIGLERFSKKRAVWKKSAIKCVLMSQRQINELCALSINDIGAEKDEYIRETSLRCTEWARDAAEKQGFRDYCAVHDPLADLFSDSGSTESEHNYNKMFFGETTDTACNNNNKRKADPEHQSCNESSQMDSGRRIRQRVVSPSDFV